jgi:hypothetical protein
MLRRSKLQSIRGYTFSGFTRRVINRIAPAMIATFGTGQPAKKKAMVPIETAIRLPHQCRMDALHIDARGGSELTSVGQIDDRDRDRQTGHGHRASRAANRR